MATQSDFQKFIAYTKKSSLARTNRYSVQIAGYPSSLNSIGENLSMMCDSTSHPGYSIGTKDSSYTNTAVMRPDGTKDYKNIMAVTFLLDEKQLIKTFFMQWMNVIVNLDDGFVGYPADYLSDTVTINQLNMMDKITYTTTLYGAYPIEISGVDVSNDAANSFSRITVQFTFTNWDSASVISN